MVAVSMANVLYKPSESTTPQIVSRDKHFDYVSSLEKRDFN